MKKLKELGITTHYTVCLHNLEIPDYMLEQIDQVDELNFGDDEFPDLAEFLDKHAKESDSHDGFYTIDYYLEDDDIIKESNGYILKNNTIYSPDNSIYLSFGSKVTNNEKEAILDILNDTLC